MRHNKKQARLEQVRLDILQRNICPDLAAQATQLVMGDGNPNADVVFIGEAPGKREDELGIPFVGASGKLLDEMLGAIGLDRQAVYITNIVKYRPPKNRDPSPLEKKAFLPYLLEQLAIIQPKVVVTLGRHSMEYFLPDAKIGQVHGQAIRREIILPDGMHAEWLIVPLYHPAAALYNGSLRGTLLNDMAGVRALLG